MDGTELPANSPDHSPDSSQQDSQRSTNECGDAVYDWNRYGRHALRVVDGNLIELPLQTQRATTRWIATMWLQTTPSRTWSRHVWPAANQPGRGWTVPTLACGDVIECGAHTPDDTYEAPARWYGLVDTYDGHAWLVLQGPYETPAAALQHADKLLAAHRYQPPVTTPSRTPRHRSRRRHLRP